MFWVSLIYATTFTGMYSQMWIARVVRLEWQWCYPLGLDQVKLRCKARALDVLSNPLVSRHATPRRI